MYEEQLGWPSAFWWALIAVTAIPAVSCVAVLLAAPEGAILAILPLLGVVALVMGIAVAFRRLRIVVDEAALTVGFGPFRERLPLARIVACEATTYRWLEYGGWGIRSHLRQPRRGATLYNVLGDGGRAVQVTLDDGRRVLFSSRDPAAVCQALRARRPDRQRPPQRPA